MGLTANRKAVTAEALNPDGESEVAEPEPVKATTTKKTTKSSKTTK